jgi:membrane-bound lytic murein transglycosylase D
VTPAVPVLEPSRAEVEELVAVEDEVSSQGVPPGDELLESAIVPSEQVAVAVAPGELESRTNEELTEALAADPSDYSVASNNTIEIQASETLGHYADWLEIKAWDVRRLNSMQYRDPVIIGDRLRLSFATVSIDEFERRRRDFHSSQQQQFFSNYRIQRVETYKVRRNDNIGRIARNRYSTPIWLLRQYNPELDFNRIQIGQEIDFPVLEAVGE